MRSLKAPIDRRRPLPAVPAWHRRNHSSTAPSTQQAPVAGANSSTEAQAQERIEKAGFTEVKGLKKDDQGIWRGRPSKATSKSTWPWISRATWRPISKGQRL